MRRAARAIIIHGDKILVMQRIKHGSEYFTLVGGRENDGESLEQALVREVKEETGLKVASARLVFIEEHPAPYNQQYIYLCEVEPFDEAKIQEDSEEGMMNRLDANIHRLKWAKIDSFGSLAFRTPQLHQAIIYSLKHGFPESAEILDDNTNQKYLPKKRTIFGRKRWR